VRISKILTFLLVILNLVATGNAQFQNKHYVSFETQEELQTYLRWTPEQPPLISAHRGGPMPAYPENCIATFENTLSYAPCLIECDVRKSKDSILVIMHDSTLDRTTTGKGEVIEYTLKELKKLKLRDNNGKVTPHRIPTLTEILEWARNKAIVELDIKRSVTPEEVVAIIQEKHAESYTIVITYDIQSAVYYHKLNSKLMISASAKGIKGTRILLNCGIESKNLLAFVGVYEPPEEVYRLLHDHGIRAILGTMGNLDRKATTHGFQIYNQLLNKGADILATDNVPLAAVALRNLIDQQNQ
jgi:glycerophosphoryl diester phosphodiesterase